MEISCPSCNGGGVRSLGDIPSHNFFAGNVLTYTIPGGFLYMCNSCSLCFRYPRLSKAELNKLYINGDPNAWQYKLEDRKDWQVAIKFLDGHMGEGKVLDMGCFDGGFLKHLRNGFELFGIEINKVAAQRAEKEGINIIANNFDELDKIGSRFDAAVGFDIIEHVENPMLFLDKMNRLVCAGGFIIVSSGNSYAPTWRFMGSKYWYCIIPEHISFINPVWIRNAAKSLHLSIEHMEMFSHLGDNRGFLNFVYESRANILYKISPSLLSRLSKLKRKFTDRKNHVVVETAPPVWMSAKDHILVVFRKQ